MQARNTLIFLLLLLLGSAGVGGCRTPSSGGTVEVRTPTAVSPTPLASTPTSPPEPTAAPVQREGVLISELLPGVPGDNNREFIELYNAGLDAVPLHNWTLWYRLGDTQEEILVYRWTIPVDVPPHGHLLLVREGETFDVVPDGRFETPLFEGKGGLVLRDASDAVVDSVGWGADAPSSIVLGAPAAAPRDGASIERLPGGSDGNGQNSGSNRDDFLVQTSPNPQNSGSVTTPAVEDLRIFLEAPDQIPPGEQFALNVQVKNVSANDAAVTVSVPIPDYFELIAAPDGAEWADGRLTWMIANVASQETAAATITLESPFTYIDTLFSSYYADADGLVRGYGAPLFVEMGGGAVPIAVARDLIGSTVTVEGVANMYTGGFFAGSTGTKFYMEDETGGIQVYADGGRGVVDVGIGDRVRVTGVIEPFRDSIEIIPLDNRTDVEIIGEAEPPSPVPISASDNENDDALLGRLNVIEGIATRVEEFNFSYEIDLLDDAGDTTLIFIEKDTGITGETLNEGARYRITGVTEFYSGRRQLKPRLPDDIEEVFPPILLLTQQGTVSANAGDELTYTITLFNHTPETVTAVTIETPHISSGATLTEISDNGAVVDTKIVWTFDELAGNGASVSVSYTVALDETLDDSIVAGPVTAVADQWPDPATTAPFFTFVGEAGVPIWAIQGSETRSPYQLAEVTTQGVVTGVFPDLNGFWIQETRTDDNPLTSAGLFVFMDILPIEVVEGEVVQISGTVQEIAGQTALLPTSRDDVTRIEGESGAVEPVVYDPPEDLFDAAVYNESLEGMLVTIEDPAIVVAPTSRFGEYALVYQSWNVNQVRRTDPVGFVMFVDDGSTESFEERADLPYAVTKGDIVRGVTGPLAYTFGNYKIAPLSLPVVEETDIARPTPLAPLDDGFGVATFNVENLFDFVPPHPSSPSPPRPGDYRTKINRIAQAVELMGFPTVIGFQEVENIDVLNDIVAEPLLAPYGYEAYLIEGFDSRGIDVGYIVRSDQASVELVSNEGASETLFARPPLLLQLTLQQSNQTVYLLNNHFLSLSAGEVATEPTRTAQAQWNAELVDELRTQNPDAEFVVLGDLNSFFETPPLDVLEAAGLRHVYRAVKGEQPYTYIFNGRTQTLDHILVSDGLFEQISLITPLHINADFPIADLESNALERISDHDPLLVVFTPGG